MDGEYKFERKYHIEAVKENNNRIYRWLWCARRLAAYSGL